MIGLHFEAYKGQALEKLWKFGFFSASGQRA